MGGCRSIRPWYGPAQRATIAVDYAETLLFTQTLFGLLKNDTADGG
jgi:hypothetical protein